MAVVDFSEGWDADEAGVEDSFSSARKVSSSWLNISSAN
jgi:hypothetical protein